MTKSLDLLKNRRSAKRYVADFKIKENDLNEILESIRFAPTSFGYEPFRVIFIENKEIREELAPGWWNQPGVTQSSGVLIWLGYKEDFFRNTILPSQLKRNIPDGFEAIREQMKGGWNSTLEGNKIPFDEWVSRQAYISAGTVLNTVEELDLDICMSEGLTTSAIEEVLKKHGLVDPKNDKVLFGAFLGKVDEKQEFHFAFEKTRRPSDEVYKIVK